MKLFHKRVGGINRISYMIHNKRSIIMAFMFLWIKWNPKYRVCLDSASDKTHPSSKNVSRCHPPTRQADLHGPILAQS